MLSDFLTTNYRQAGAGGVGLLFALFAALTVSTQFSGGVLCASDEAYRLEELKEAPPAGVAADVRKVIASEGLRVLGPKGMPMVDVWMRKSVDTKESAGLLGIDFGSLRDGALLGVVRYHERADDFRGEYFRPGIYTFRYGIRPEDGEHQGTSETRDFVLLCPVDLDVKTDPMPTKEVVKLSVKVSRRKHPSILYLVKMFDKPEKLPRLVNQAEKEYWVLDFQIPVEGKDAKAAIRMGLVLVGLAPEF